MKTAIMKTEKGDIHIEFFDGEAPNTVKNFTDLIQDGLLWSKFSSCHSQLHVPRLWQKLSVIFRFEFFLIMTVHLNVTQYIRIY